MLANDAWYYSAEKPEGHLFWAGEVPGDGWYDSPALIPKATGLYAASLGAPQNETSGRALMIAAEPALVVTDPEEADVRAELFALGIEPKPEWSLGVLKMQLGKARKAAAK